MTAPLLRLTIDETWYDKAGGLVTRRQGRASTGLEPGEVGTVKIETPFNPKMKANNYNFAHANGTIKPHKVAKLVPRGRRQGAGDQAGCCEEEVRIRD